MGQRRALSVYFLAYFIETNHHLSGAGVQAISPKGAQGSSKEFVSGRGGLGTTGLEQGKRQKEWGSPLL